MEGFVKSKVFSDSSFTQGTHQFNVGQTVYVRVEVSGSGDKERNLYLLDGEKNEFRKIVLERSGDGPFVFTAEFLAPEMAGVYYLDIKIKSDGFSFSSQENINVSGESKLEVLKDKPEGQMEEAVEEEILENDEVFDDEDLFIVKVFSFFRRLLKLLLDKV